MIPDTEEEMGFGVYSALRFGIVKLKIRRRLRAANGEIA